MKRSSLLFFTGAALLLLAASLACSKSGGSNNNNNNNNSTGKDSVLLNIGNNIILPSYQALVTSVNSLDSAIGAFNGSPDNTKLTNVQTLFKTAYINWQSASEYDYFGPASTAQPVLSTINVFPTNDSIINANINSNNTNVNAFVNTPAKGFPALDYLLFGAGTGTLANYTTDALAANRKSYLAVVSADIKTEVNTVLTAWSSSGGNYINTFVNGTGNSVSSSLGLLINSLNQDFENLKNYDLGVPLGLIPVGSNTPVAPKEVEALYSGISVQLALAQMKAVQGIYLGTGQKGNGNGLINYLVNANAKYGNGLLSDTLKAALALGVSDLQLVPDPLSQTLQTSPAVAVTAFTQSQKLVALLKTDMPSSLGVLITYGDNDGD